MVLGGASISLKFGGVICVTFTLEKAMMAAGKLANDYGVVVNTDFKHLVNNRTNQAIVLKEIPVKTSVETVHTAVSEFERIKAIKIQLVGLWQKAIIKLEDQTQAELLASKWSILIRKDVVCVARTNIDKQSWDARDNFRALLHTLPVETTAHDLWDFIGSIGGKTCFIDRNPSNYSRACCASVCFGSELDLVNAIAVTLVIKGVGLCWSRLSLASCTVCKNFGHTSLSYELEKHLVGIKSSLISLMKQIGELAKRLDSLMLAVSQPSPGCQLLVTPSSQNLEGDIVMGAVLSKTTSDETAVIVDSSMSSQVTRLKNMLEGLSKSVLSLSARFESSVLAGGIINKFNDVRVFTSGLDSGYWGASVVIIIDSFLARHVCKVSEVPGWLLSIKLLFKNKLLAVNESSFVILGGNFNEDGLRKSMSFKKCLDLGLVNSLSGSSVAKNPMWENSRGMKKTIDYMFVSSSLVNAIIHRDVLKVGEHYDMDYQAVSVSIGLDGLLDAQLNSLHKQTNRNCWKFDFKGADEIKWNNFKGAILANATMFSDEFAVSVQFSDLDAMWDIIHKIMVLSTSKVFKKKWFKGFDNVFTKESLRFHKLELLVSKIVKALHEECVANFESFIEHWVSLDDNRTSVVQSVVDSGAGTDDIHSALFSARRSYHISKLAESLKAKEANIRSAIDKKMESFEVDKGHTIRSVLEQLFCKVVLDHLVMGDELVLEPNLYRPLDYIFNEVFSGMMCVIDFDELHHVVSNLSNGKAAGLLGISNKL
ncbi:hypothetical protein G9A89_023030 [Geosiphon pyriformis]|nr:hypothetical protein G9A89_023030 [Geosiphon pyriformis]